MKLFINIQICSDKNLLKHDNFIKYYWDRNMALC